MTTRNLGQRSLSIDWVNLMEKYKKIDENLSGLESEKEEVNTVFCSGSSYAGRWNVFGMTEHGIYRFANGVEYEGQLFDGTFHGEGILTFPSGYIIKGTWKNGNVQEQIFIFSDDIEFKEKDWDYCIPPDRRYSQCVYYGIPGIGDSYLTSYKPPRKIPDECYDVEEGFYNPKTKCIYDAKDLNHIIRIPSQCEEDWIIENCRKWTIDSIGFDQGIINNETKILKKN